jgi:tetratricopeptide (TPR) repeat protein
MLHFAAGDNASVQRFLATQVKTLGAQKDAVRDRWTLALRMQGDRYLQDNQLQAALVIYRKGLEVEPDNSALLMNLGVTYARLGDYPSAIAQLGRSVALDPQSSAWLELGLTQTQQGDIAGAVHTYRAGIAAKPWDAALYANLGAAYLKSGDVPAATSALERAVTLQPSLAGAQFVLANAYANARRFKDAAAALERGLEFDPKNDGARRMLDVMRQSASRSGG